MGGGVAMQDTGHMDPKDMIEAAARLGPSVDFGKASSDYGKFRAGFPEAFFSRLAEQIALRAGLKALDIGTGTGTVARSLARRGLDVIGVDPSPEMMQEGAEIARREGVSVDFREGRAETLVFTDQTFDIVTAGQCWHWFERERAAAEAFRVLKPGGHLVICHFDWLPLRGNVVEATEQLIMEANPAWALAGGTGVYPHWPADMANAGFTGLETRSFDIAQPYSHEAWRGRIRASAGIKASLDAEATARFDEMLASTLRARFPEDPLAVPHRVWWIVGERP